MWRNAGRSRLTGMFGQEGVPSGDSFARRVHGARVGAVRQAPGKAKLVCRHAAGERNLSWLSLHVRLLGFPVFRIDGGRIRMGSDTAPLSSSDHELGYLGVLSYGKGVFCV